jgi:uncharacterized phage protein gp47/JayE
MDFETVTDNIIPAGTLAISCMVEAIEVGTDGNIGANEILNKIDGYDAVQGFSVSNPDAFSGGLDYEEDDVFRDRIIAHMSQHKFGSQPYYISALAEEFPDAHDILFTTATGYTAKVIPNTYKGSTAQTQLVNDVQAYLENDNNKMMGHNFTVASPTTKSITIHFSEQQGASAGVWIKLSDYTTDTVNKAKEVLNCYFKGGQLSFAPLDFNGLNASEDLDPLVMKESLSSAMDSSFIRLGIVGDMTLGSYNKYTWIFVL